MLILLLSASGSPPGTLSMMGVLREWPTGTRREQAACQMLGRGRPPQQASRAAVRVMREARMRQESRGASFTFEIGIGLTKLEPVVISMDNLLPTKH